MISLSHHCSPFKVPEEVTLIMQRCKGSTSLSVIIHHRHQKERKSFIAVHTEAIFTINIYLFIDRHFNRMNIFFSAIYLFLFFFHQFYSFFPWNQSKFIKLRITNLELFLIFKSKHQIPLCIFIKLRGESQNLLQLILKRAESAFYLLKHGSTDFCKWVIFFILTD